MYLPCGSNTWHGFVFCRTFQMHKDPSVCDDINSLPSLCHDTSVIALETNVITIFKHESCHPIFYLKYTCSYFFEIISLGLLFSQTAIAFHAFMFIPISENIHFTNHWNFQTKQYSCFQLKIVLMKEFKFRVYKKVKQSKSAHGTYCIIKTNGYY